MVTGNAKKVVVIKNISSDFIEEVILFLKCDPGAQNGSILSKNLHRKASFNNKFLIKEAEVIIDNFIKENRLQIVQNKRGHNKIGPLRNKTFINFLINSMLFASIVFLIYLATKLI